MKPYLSAIDRVFERLAENPQIGHSCDQIRAGYRKHVVGRHVVFYRVIDTGIEVVRILHQNMDFERYF